MCSPIKRYFRFRSLKIKDRNHFFITPRISEELDCRIKKYQPLKSSSECFSKNEIVNPGKIAVCVLFFRSNVLIMSDIILNSRTKIIIFIGIHNQMIFAGHNVSLSILVTNDCELRLTCDRLGDRG